MDALDEADSKGGPTAFQRLPENRPSGVYIIATTRPVTDRTSLARRAHLHWYDLDAPDLLQANLADGMEYVQGELAHSDLPGATLDEVARRGRGNFLVLKLLCDHVRTRLEPAEVGEFSRRLSTGTAKDQLGFVYEEFWSRLASRLSREDTTIVVRRGGTAGNGAGSAVGRGGLRMHRVACGRLGLRPAALGRVPDGRRTERGGRAGGVLSDLSRIVCQLLTVEAGR